MGRYYSGDIEGKFWFGLQSSVAADRFGVTHCEPDFVEYYFDEENLQSVKDEIKKIKKTLGSKFQTIENFFENKNSYSDSELYSIGINREDMNEYADLLLGIKIRDSLIENGSCSFTADL